ncbi:MAG: ABC transporter ATP-binding protein [Burkholderiales bacterium]|jgi:branched-chain amino acid transport system ATP-binding protein|nr:ABC transporter ATP-binding protein [Burkholderiales bacterium]ODU72351.1 MAG: ABC transporter ATP-binding protein [Lautropia sp. SCN 66-9]
MSTILKVSGLSKSFGAINVANDVSFDVEEGEILGVIGPNGAGKTTLFGMLSGHVEPSSGRVEFRNEDITTLPPHDRARRGIARTYQVPRPFGQMSVFDNLRVAATFAGGLSGAEATAWIERTLAATGLTRFADTLAGRLPLLVRKRHELARALAMRPKLLLIDEVAAGLTEQEVGEFIELVQRIRNMGTTVVWIEHVIRTMLTATDRLMALAGGQVLALGVPNQVIQSPEVKRVYLGS